MFEKRNKQAEREQQIYQLSTLVAGKLSLQEVLDKLVKAAVKIIGVKAGAIRILDEEAGELQMSSTWGLSQEYQNRGVVSKNDAVIKAAFAGEAVVLDNMRLDDRVKHKEAAIKEGLVSQLTVGIHFRNKPIGVLRLYSFKKKDFTPEDISLARAVASQCAVAITNARLYASAIEGARMADQMKLAGVIQRRMIPEKAPLIPGLDVAAAYIPCFDVGGDFYDFLKIDDSRIVIAISDVIGKGVPAALMMSMFRGAIRAYADTQSGINKARKIIDKLNKMAFDECRDGEFISLFYAIIDVENKSLMYCDCGHEPMLLIEDGEIRQLAKGGLVLGVDRNAEYDIETVMLKDGDCLVLYTDGLTDAMNFDGQFWGKERFFEAAKKLSAGSAYQMVNNILRFRRRFVGLARQTDDTSIIVAKFDRTAAPAFMKQADF